MPPSMAISAPVMWRAASDARKQIVSATSSAEQATPIGTIVFATSCGSRKCVPADPCRERPTSSGPCLLLAGGSTPTGWFGYTQTLLQRPATSYHTEDGREGVGDG